MSQNGGSGAPLANLVSILVYGAIVCRLVLNDPSDRIVQEFEASKKTLEEWAVMAGHAKDMRELADRLEAIRLSDGSPMYKVEIGGNGHYQVTNLETGAKGGFSHSPSAPSLKAARATLGRTVGYTWDMWTHPEKYRGRQQMEASNSVAHNAGLVVPKMEELTSYSAALFLWKWVKFVEVPKGGVTESSYFKGVLGYKWEGRLPEIVKALWPGIQALDPDTRKTLVTRIVNAGRERGYVSVTPGNPAKPSILHIWEEWAAEGPGKGDLALLEKRVISKGEERVQVLEEEVQGPVQEAVGPAQEAVPEPTITWIPEADPVEDVLFKAALEVRELREYRRHVEEAIERVSNMSSQLIGLGRDLDLLLRELKGEK